MWWAIVPIQAICAYIFGSRLMAARCNSSVVLNLSCVYWLWKWKASRHLFDDSYKIFWYLHPTTKFNYVSGFEWPHRYTLGLRYAWERHLLSHQVLIITQGQNSADRNSHPRWQAQQAATWHAQRLHWWGGYSHQISGNWKQQVATRRQAAIQSKRRTEMM